MEKTHGELDTILIEVRALLARSNNDFTWSSWTDRRAALAELDELIAVVAATKVRSPLTRASC